MSIRFGITNYDIYTNFDMIWVKQWTLLSDDLIVSIKQLSYVVDSVNHISNFTQ